MQYVWPIPRIRYQALTEVQDARNVALIYQEQTWQAVGERLSLSIHSKAEVHEATIEHWEQLSESIEGDVVYAVGGGLTVDAAKFVAAKRNLPLVCIPTALSVDAFLTWASGYRSEGCVKYLETKPPDDLIVDFEVLANAPVSIRAAGISDVLSIATGCHDWKLADSKGLNPSDAPYDEPIAAIAGTVLDAAMACAPSAGRGEPEGLSRLLECLALEVQFCNFIGHSRPEEGSEHYFAYAAEEVLGKGLPHGDLVGPGIVVMARAQGQDTAPLIKALKACGVPLNSIPADTIREILRTLPEYSRRHGFPYGRAHELTPEIIEGLDLTW